MSSTLGCIVGALVNYTLSYDYVLRSSGSHPHTMTKCLSVVIFGLGLNTLAPSFEIYGLRLHYLVGQVLATGIVVIWNFVGNQWWTFREAEYGMSR